MALLSPCVDAFILSILCSNPILKGGFLTILNNMVLQLDQEITLLIAQTAKLNIANQILDLQIKAVEGIINKVQTDLNLILTPLQEFTDCPELSRLNETIQSNAVGKKVSGLQKKLYEWRRASNLVNLQNSLIKVKERRRDEILAMIDRINILC